MNKLNPKVDEYLAIGCGRCKFYNTPDCKVKKWPVELEALREIALESGLEEEVKWSMPCYTSDGKNILIVSAFKNYASISFFKGSLLKDSNKLLVKQGENSHEGRVAKFTSIDEIEKVRPHLKAYIQEAIDIEKKGLKVEKPTTELVYPEELIAKMEEDASFKRAFESLTPGRQKGYIFYFNQPKKSQTRVSRIEKSAAKIFEGKGWNDR
jgi:uncharacterized protein YdeI (YjbR/CyaY-like superfamily)